MTTRFCYFPILGNITYGLVGDIIDMLSGPLSLSRSLSRACTFSGVRSPSRARALSCALSSVVTKDLCDCEHSQYAEVHVFTPCVYTMCFWSLGCYYVAL